MLEYYSILKNKHIDSTCFICGCGTSFFDIINSGDFVRVNDHIVISVNSSIIALPWEKGEKKNRYWISNDSSVRLWNYWEKVKSCIATKIIRDSWEKYYSEIPEDFLFFSPRPSKDKIDYDEDKLSFVSSVPTAIDLAIQMGCKKVFLLGCDHHALNNKSYFWQFFPKNKQPSTKGYYTSISAQNIIFAQNMRTYELLKEFADYRQCEIFNCSVNSRIKVFDKIKFESIFDGTFSTAR